jgi:ABC-type multidrug transport system fused ATPase/permease subunit
LNLKDFRQLVGYVGQEPVLFNATIRENMLYGNPNANDDEMRQALQSANAWDFINDKMGFSGLETNVGNAGG